MNKIIITLFVTAFCLTACDKEETIERALVPEFVSWNYSANDGSNDRVTAYNAYWYDESGRYDIVDYVYDSSRSGLYKSNIEFTYNEQDELASVKTTTYHSGNKTERVKNYVRTGHTIDIIEEDEISGYIKLDEKSGKAIRYTYYQNSFEGRYVYEYEYIYDSAGNLSGTVEWFVNPSSERREEKRYDSDTKNGIYKNVNMPQWYLVTNGSSGLGLINNRLYSYIKNPDGSEFRFEIYDYEYNEHGYPTKMYSYLDSEWVGGSATSYIIRYVEKE
ncbi:MAG: hypothetical protein LUH10_14785 [Tannerellaceae bacterium]|nr:hypothetical protein [Tannerellaceae bacterium]